MDHQTRCDEQQNQAMSMAKTHEFTCKGRAVTRPAVMTPTSLAGRCDHIIRLIDEVLTVTATCANTADARDERRCRESLRTEPRVWGVGGGGDDVAS